MRVFLAGEGATDLGDWSKEAPYRGAVPGPGIVEALLRQVAPDVQIVDAVCWKHIRKYQAGKNRRPEQRNVLGLALMASERGCAALVFARDRDGDEERQEHIESGLRDAQRLFPALRVVGGVAVEEIEAWLLALLGERRSEGRRDAKARLKDVHGICSLAEMLQLVERIGLDSLPQDADSLRGWLERARTACAG